jgi:hypothetical protein
MLALMTAPAVELARALRLGAARLLRRRRERVKARSLSRMRRRRLPRPLLRSGARSGGGHDAERDDGEGQPSHEEPRVANRGASGPRSAFGSPIGGGSRCLMAVWQRPHSMFLPATWKSWTKAASV